MTTRPALPQTFEPSSANAPRSALKYFNSGALQINPALTDLAVGVHQGPDKFAYRKVAPLWKVQRPYGRYRIWNRADLMRDDAVQTAAAGGAPPVGMPRQSDDDYHTTKFHRACLITEADRKAYDGQGNLDEIMTNVLVDIIRIRMERHFASKAFAASKWGTTVSGGTAAEVEGESKDFVQFDDPTNSAPVTFGKTKLRTTARGIGKAKSDLIAVMGRGGLDTLEEHPAILGKYETVQVTAGLPASAVARAWGCKDIVVSDAAYATSNPVDDAADASTTVASILGNHVLFCYAPENGGDMLQPSGAKMATLDLEGMNEEGFRVRSWEHADLDGRVGTVILVETEVDFVVTMPAGGIFLADAFSASVS